MAVLSDRHLSDLYPEYRGAIGPASIDLHIGTTLFAWPLDVPRDPRVDQSGEWRSVPLVYDHGRPCWWLTPGTRYLAATRERIKIPIDHAGQIGARSSWARDGLSVIQGPAGWCDPDYLGNPTLELSVIGSDLAIWPGASVCQLIVFQLTSECDRPYQGKYAGDTEATPSRLWQEVPA